jgi:hypothetical protein
MPHGLLLLERLGEDGETSENAVDFLTLESLLHFQRPARCFLKSSFFFESVRLKSSRYFDNNFTTPLRERRYNRETRTVVSSHGLKSCFRVFPVATRKQTVCPERFRRGEEVSRR